jgi:4-hydroxy-tetrahydrodipicolinate reductase
VLAAGNFALTAVLLQKFARMAAALIPHWEIIDYAGAGKVDVPSGTAMELASQLGRIRASTLEIPTEELHGPKETRGARLNGSQVHSVRLPGYVLSAEAIFGMPDQKLVIRHEAGSSAMPYVDGAMLAVRKVNTFKGLRRGLETIMDI